MRLIPALIISLCLFVSCNQNRLPEPGVSRQLAAERKSRIDSLSYSLFFSIPEKKDERIRASNQVRFYLHSAGQPVILDFKEVSSNIHSVSLNGEKSAFEFKNEHIILNKNLFRDGWNEIKIEFNAGDLSLNRQEDYLYSLFVPDRARTAFPCFDQPDMKASFILQLEIPSDWEACANGKESEIKKSADRKLIKFEATRPLPTYLFAFAAGKFEIISRSRADFEVRMFHRETDTLLLHDNTDDIFNQVFSSLEWMEEYTSIPYPFAKYDLVIIPSFQYSGMEHTGATLYRSGRLFLSSSPTEDQLLARANLIAHETAHMWFGDLVTMKWFDEVWLKEVFANFIAEKITNPWFPDTDHNLKFLAAHYPAAYEIDRSPGANPILQDLDNLENAGSVYGSIIYHKAPIVMRKLEQITGQEDMRTALREYLKNFSYSNAGWSDLISILEKTTGRELESWSGVWIRDAGMPCYYTEASAAGSTRITQSDPENRGLYWPDRLMCSISGADTLLQFTEQEAVIPGAVENELFLNSDGQCYGSFLLDEGQVSAYLDRFVRDYKGYTNTFRYSQLLILYENMLNASLKPGIFMDRINRLIPIEQNNIILGKILDIQARIYWQFLHPEERNHLSPKLSEILWEEFYKRAGTARKLLFEQLTKLETTGPGLAAIREIWKNGGKADMKLSESDQLGICYELCLKLPGDYNALKSFQLERTQNPDRKKSLEFILPALDPDRETRKEFFGSLKLAGNRETESDVITAVHYLNHPLRNEAELIHLSDYLEILPEIQMTGDIFFPKRWLDAAFGYQNSDVACSVVSNFLAKPEGLSSPLTLKILQSTDMMYRSNNVLNQKK